MIPTNPLDSAIPMMVFTQQQLMLPPNSEITQVENSSSVVMKGAQQIQVSRSEPCIDCGWDFRSSTYNSQQGSHKIKVFDPCCCNACICWPLKKCCCSYNIPPHISNEMVLPDQISVVFPNQFHGAVYVKGVAIGSFEFIKPGCLWQCLLFQQPKIVIKKAVTNEQLVLKPNDNCLLGLLEQLFGCFLTSKAMYLEKQGSTIEGRYSRSILSAFLNYLCCNPHFYDNLNIDFQQFIKTDAEKVLVYSAFVFLQENTKASCFSVKYCCSTCLCCCVI